jgi:hypothetical protein
MPSQGNHRQTIQDAILRLRDTRILGTRQLEAWSLLFNQGPMTASELERAAGLLGRGLHKRLSELKGLGLVSEKEVRHCRITGRNSIVWEAVQPDPDRRYARRQIREFWLVREKGSPELSPRVYGYRPARIDEQDYEIIHVREVARRGQ